MPSSWQQVSTKNYKMFTPGGAGDSGDDNRENFKKKATELESLRDRGTAVSTSREVWREEALVHDQVGSFHQLAQIVKSTKKTLFKSLKPDSVLLSPRLKSYKIADGTLW
jgi:hypothetical protein